MLIRLQHAGDGEAASTPTASVGGILVYRVSAPASGAKLKIHRLREIGQDRLKNELSGVADKTHFEGWRLERASSASSETFAGSAFVKSPRVKAAFLQSRLV